MDTVGNFPFRADLTIFSFAIHRDFIIMTSEFPSQPRVAGGCLLFSRLGMNTHGLS